MAKGHPNTYLIRGCKDVIFGGDLKFKFRTQEFEKFMMFDDFSFQLLGGGVIDHDVHKKTIQVFGFCAESGTADHLLTTQLLEN